MSKSELRNVNPVQLLLLEASHSMFDGRHKADNNVGIFVGLFSSLLTPGSSTAAPSREPLGIYEGTANSTSIASGRISYVLGFTGPCLPVDTACSASLVAHTWPRPHCGKTSAVARASWRVAFLKQACTPHLVQLVCSQKLDGAIPSMVVRMDILVARVAWASCAIRLKTVPR